MSELCQNGDGPDPGPQWPRRGRETVSAAAPFEKWPNRSHNLKDSCQNGDGPSPGTQWASSFCSLTWHTHRGQLVDPCAPRTPQNRCGPDSDALWTQTRSKLAYTKLFSTTVPPLHEIEIISYKMLKGPILQIATPRKPKTLENTHRFSQPSCAVPRNLIFLTEPSWARFNL